MRLAVLIVVLLAACKGESKQEASAAARPPEPVIAAEPAKPPDDMDEKMRHCPLSLAGTKVTVSEVEGGVKFELRGDAATRDELIKRSRHVVQFAAGAAAGAHGGGQGGGKMRNCPVVTNGVAITFDETATTLTVKPAAGGSVDELRRETKARLDRFAFDGVTIERR